MNNVEKLRNYFLGKDPQLKETMADNSLRLIGIPGREFVLKAELYKRLVDLKKQVDDKDEELQANIDDVIEALSGEQEARMADDEALQRNIDAEAATRAEMDTALADNFELLSDEMGELRTDLGDQLQSKQDKLIAGEGIALNGNVISASINTEWTNIENRPSINNFVQDLNLVDGNGSNGLADGIYFTDNYKVYINNVESYFFNHAVILSTGGDTLYVISSPYNARQPLGFYEVYYNSSTGTWNTGYQGMQTDWSLINNKPAGLENYSTYEQVIGTWIDNKPLYSKTATARISTSSGSVSIRIDPNMKMGFIHDSFIMGSDNMTRALPSLAFQSSTLQQTSITVSRGEVTFENNNPNVVGYTLYVTVYYTKTTD